MRVFSKLSMPCACALFMVTVSAGAPAVIAAERDTSGLIEEIIVTARQQAESLQDVPVTVAVFTERDLDRYNIKTLTEASKLVPNFQVNHGEAGNGSNLYLRGVGSSSISAAFDQSVAINVDDVVVNIGRFIHNAYLDMGQLEILKGPQSLYFGKSATAGVVSIKTNDPGDEFELEAMAAYENEHDQTYTEFIVSGPITDTFGARLAVGTTRADKRVKNLNTTAKNRWHKEDTTDARLTLVWDASDRVTAKLKFAYSEFENDGGIGNIETRCVDGARQSTSVLGIPRPNVFDDCKLNGNMSLGDVAPQLRVGLPYGGADGVPFLEQETVFTSLRVDWDVNDTFDLTSVTGYIDLDHTELDQYSGSDGGYLICTMCAWCRSRYIAAVNERRMK